MTDPAKMHRNGLIQQLTNETYLKIADEEVADFWEDLFKSEKKPVPPFHEWKHNGLWYSCDSNGEFFHICGDAQRDQLKEMARVLEEESKDE